MSDLGPSIRVTVQYFPDDADLSDGQKWGQRILLGRFDGVEQTETFWDYLGLSLGEVVTDIIRDEVKEYARERSNG